MEIAVWWSSEKLYSVSPDNLIAKSCALLAVTVADEQCQSLSTEDEKMESSLLSYTHEYDKTFFFSFS